MTFRWVLARVTWACNVVFSPDNIQAAEAYLGKFIFFVVLFSFTFPVWVVTKVNLFIAARFPSHLPRTHRITLLLCSWAWWIVFRCCCCILGMKAEGVREMNKAMRVGAGKPRAIIGNHVSFMDSMLIHTYISSRSSMFTKSLFSAHLVDMPIVGSLCVGCGHIPVAFNSQDTVSSSSRSGGSVANFSVDKEAAAKTMEEFDKWLKDGNIACWFPEGRMSPHPLKLQMFRAGGFKSCVDTDCEMWCVVSAGAEVFWNRKDLIGGTPANVGVKAFRLCSSTHALIKELVGEGNEVDDKLKCVLLANHAQALMQEKRDELTADVWVTKPKDLISSDSASSQVELPALSRPKDGLGKSMRKSVQFEGDIVAGGAASSTDAPRDVERGPSPGQTVQSVDLLGTGTGTGGSPAAGSEDLLGMADGEGAPPELGRIPTSPSNKTLDSYSWMPMR